MLPSCVFPIWKSWVQPFSIPQSCCAQLCCRSPAHTLQTTLNMHEGQRNRGLRHDGKRLKAGQSALNCVLLLHADMNFLGICSVSHDAAVMLTHQITSHVTSLQGQWQLVLIEHKYKICMFVCICLGRFIKCITF